MSPSENLGDLLRRLRGERTLWSFTEAIGVKSPQTIGNWERGLQLPPEDKISVVKSAYGITSDSEDERMFDQFYAEIKRKRALDTGPALVDRDQGVTPMIVGLEDLAALAKQDSGARYVLHSVSNQGFLTHSNPDLREAVFECAVAGVDVVFFPQPGEHSPEMAKADLHDALKKGVVDYIYKKHDGDFDRKSLLRHFSVLSHKHSPITSPLPASQDELEEWASDFVKSQLGSTKPKCASAVTDLVMCVSAAANWLGSFLRFLVEIRVEKSKELRTPEFGSIERICPTEFKVERIWLHLVTFSPDKKVKRHTWVHIDDESGRFALEYGRELGVRRERGLLESSPIFKR